MARGISVKSYFIGSHIEHLSKPYSPPITKKLPKSQLKLLNKILSKLTKYQKSVFIMYYGDNVLIRDISIFLNKSPSNITFTLYYLKHTKIPKLLKEIKT